jgi:hypothetical protein
LITTVAFPLPASACTTLFARVLNADHCLQASMVTEMLPVAAAGSPVDDEAAVVASLVFFVFFGAGAFFLASVFLAFTGFGTSSVGSSLAAAGTLALAELLRVVRPIVPIPTEFLPE